MRAISRTVQILSAVRACPSGVSLKDIAEYVGLSPATTHRFIQALLDVGFLHYTADGKRYSIGSELQRLANYNARPDDLRVLARTSLEALQRATRETVSLVVPAGSNRVTTDVVLSAHELRAAPEVYSVKPVYAGAAGKALLAWYSEAAFEGVVSRGMRKLAAGTITDLGSLHRELHLIRERGYAISKCETVTGQAASAAPIFAADGRVIGSINISGPEVRLPPEKLGEYGALVADATRKLSKELYGSMTRPKTCRNGKGASTEELQSPDFSVS